MTTITFAEKSKAPAANDLKTALGNNHKYWIEIRDYVLSRHKDVFINY